MHVCCKKEEELRGEKKGEERRERQRDRENKPDLNLI